MAPAYACTSSRGRELMIDSHYVEQLTVCGAAVTTAYGVDANGGIGVGHGDWGGHGDGGGAVSGVAAAASLPACVAVRNDRRAAGGGGEFLGRGAARFARLAGAEPQLSANRFLGLRPGRKPGASGVD